MNHFKSVNTSGYILHGAKILHNCQMQSGTVTIEDDFILSIEANKKLENLKKSYPVVDLTGFWVLPGIIDLHGDGFERQLFPRPDVSFDINETLKMLNWLVISFAILREVYLTIKRLVRKFSKKVNEILSLRAEMMLLSYDLEGKNIGTYSTIDTEDILNKIRELRKKSVGYPPLLIHLFKKELDKGNYNLKIK